MGCLEELKAGKFAVYAQWGGLISSILLIICGFGNLIGSYIFFSIVGISEGIVLFLLEVTFLAKCIRGTDRLIELSKNNKMKVGVYLIASITMWLSLFVGASSLILPAIILSITTFLYGGAVARNEDAAKSSVLSQEGIARSVISRV